MFLTSEEDIEKRLDIFLSANTDLSRTYCQKLIHDRAVSVNGKEVTKVAHLLKENQDVSCIIPEPKNLEILPEDIPLDILYEDKDLVVVNKPAGMVVHPDETYSSGTLVNALLFHIGPKKLSGIGGVKRPGIVHRLDRETSGVMMVAKNDAAHRYLSNEIAERRITKFYKALVFGKMKHDSFTVDSPIARDRKDRKKMAVSNERRARSAVTHGTLLQVFPDPLTSYLKLQIVTGRTHQIRVHLASIGSPVVGDTVYGKSAENELFFRDHVLKRCFLHSESLTFTLPSGKEKTFVAPLAPDLERTLEALGSSGKT